MNPNHWIARNSPGFEFTSENVNCFELISVYNVSKGSSFRVFSLVCGYSAVLHYMLKRLSCQIALVCLSNHLTLNVRVYF